MIRSHGHQRSVPLRDGVVVDGEEIVDVGLRVENHGQRACGSAGHVRGHGVLL